MTIEVFPGSEIYVVDFSFENHRGISIAIPATCELTALLKARILFPEYKHIAIREDVRCARYIEIDWETGRCIVVTAKKRPSPRIPSARPIRKSPPQEEDED